MLFCILPVKLDDLHELSTKARFQCKTTSCLKQTMPFSKDASSYFCILLVIKLRNDDQHISDPDLPKQLHMLHIYACFHTHFH